ncbi:MAG: 4-hydroxy-3-methylbut-2-en-1-yl diphosphate synthase [Tannerella sp.]|nr:4-hydroxy-3-methylbut-2-en-1-yl diphosphate synthase [Tannerella sp.]
MILQYQRRKTSEVRIGSTPAGGANPVRIQSMANVSTMDTEAAVQQAIRMINAGAEYVRFTAQGEREAGNLGVIRRKLAARGYTTPLIADIHFNPKAADIAAVQVQKVRINPGNYVDSIKTFQQMEYTDEAYAVEINKIRERFIPFLQQCRKRRTAIRIGVNHGSLSDRIMSRYGDTPEGMAASCMEFLRICKEVNFEDAVVSVKASNTVVMAATVRLLVQTMDAEDMHYPLHLGVTEAGNEEDGRIKSAVGIGALLIDGIGDTIRVSLSEEPEAELPVARKLVSYISTLEGHEPVQAPDACRISGFRRETFPVHRIGGGQVPVVISDRSCGDFVFDESNMPDYIYTGNRNPLPQSLPYAIPLLVDVACWQQTPNTFPYFKTADLCRISQCNAALKLVELTCSDLNSGLPGRLTNDPAVVIVLTGQHPNTVYEMRAFIGKIKEAGCNNPVILRKSYAETDKEMLQLKAAVDLGSLLLDGIGNGITLSNEGTAPSVTDSYQFSILQAARVRISKTEYISCPGCGRTLYNLHATIARVKEATSHLKGLKIGIMGCIVNGPGEMADADYGYVGAGRGRISLYKGKTCMLKNIPEEEAVEQLIELIKANGDWKERDHVLKV